jgi:hypothetical protein
MRNGIYDNSMDGMWMVKLACQGLDPYNFDPSSKRLNLKNSQGTNTHLNASITR